MTNFVAPTNSPSQFSALSRTTLSGAAFEGQPKLCTLFRLWEQTGRKAETFRTTAITWISSTPLQMARGHLCLPTSFTGRAGIFCAASRRRSSALMKRPQVGRSSCDAATSHEPWSFTVNWQEMFCPLLYTQRLKVSRTLRHHAHRSLPPRLSAPLTPSSCFPGPSTRTWRDKLQRSDKTSCGVTLLVARFRDALLARRSFTGLGPLRRVPGEPAAFSRG